MFDKTVLHRSSRLDEFYFDIIFFRPVNRRQGGQLGSVVKLVLNDRALSFVHLRKNTISRETARDARVSNDVFLEAVCLHNLAEVALHLKELEKSADFATRSLELFESLCLRPNIARTKLMQSQIAILKGEIDRAFELQREGLSEFGEIGDKQGIAEAFEVIAATLSVQGTDHELAMLLASAAAALRDELKIWNDPAKEKLFRTHMKRSRRAVGKSAESAASRGRTLSLSQVIELVRNRIF